MEEVNKPLPGEEASIEGKSSFLQLSYEEVAIHTTWPTRIELIAQSLAVLVASLLFALLIGGADALLEALMKFIYSF
jgi:preprotein translocase subunit SecE